MGSQEAAPNLLQTVLTNQNAVFLGFLAVWGPPVGRCIPAKNGFSGQPLRTTTASEASMSALYLLWPRRCIATGFAP